ncbi:MAG: exonuclease sbcCD subunit D, partial [Candidatus Sericytochromatia bacterium]
HLYKVIVKLEAPVVGLADRVRKACPQALQIEPRYPNAPEHSAPAIDPKGFSPIEAYQRFYAERVGGEPQPAVLETFAQLYEEMANASA